MLAVGIVAGLTFVLTTILSAIYSDRVGRRRVIVYGTAFAAAFSLALFPIVDIGTTWAFALGLCITLGLIGVAYGPAGAYLPEIFATRYRYTGAGMAYNLAGVLGGALPPIFAASLVTSYGSYAIGIYLAAMGLLSLLCVLALRETKDVDMTADTRVTTA